MGQPFVDNEIYTGQKTNDKNLNCYPDRHLNTSGDWQSEGNSNVFAAEYPGQIYLWKVPGNGDPLEHNKDNRGPLEQNKDKNLRVIFRILPIYELAKGLLEIFKFRIRTRTDLL